MTQWRNRTYTYSEPIDSTDAIDTNGLSRGAETRPDYDAGYEEGRKAGWSAGYEYARRLNHDLAVERAGEGPPFLL